MLGCNTPALIQLQCNLTSPRQYTTILWRISTYSDSIDRLNLGSVSYYWNISNPCTSATLAAPLGRHLVVQNYIIIVLANTSQILTVERSTYKSADLKENSISFNDRLRCYVPCHYGENGFQVPQLTNACWSYNWLSSATLPLIIMTFTKKKPQTTVLQEYAKHKRRASDERRLNPSSK